MTILRVNEHSFSYSFPHHCPSPSERASLTSDDMIVLRPSNSATVWAPLAIFLAVKSTRAMMWSRASSEMFQ